MTTTQATIVECARGFLGTPFGHQGRRRGPRGSVDCVGLLVGVAEAAGIAPLAPIPTNYRARPTQRDWLVSELREHMIECQDRAIAVGRVLVFAFDRPMRAPCHVGIVTDRPRGHGIIHASNASKRVVEHVLSEEWAAKCCLAFRWRGVVED